MAALPRSADDATDFDGGVRAAERALRVLGVFTEDHKLEWSLEEVAARTDLPKSTTHRLLATIMHQRYIEPGIEFGSYRLALHTAVVGRIALGRARPNLMLDSILGRLAEDLGVTAGLSVRHQTSCIGVDRVMARRALNWDLGTGVSGPCHCTAGGKLLLARLENEEITDLYRNLPQLAAVTPRSITTMEGLLRELEAVRDRGFAVDDREFKSDASCVAVPVEIEGEEAFALVVAAPSVEHSSAELVSMIPALRRYATEMETSAD